MKTPLPKKFLTFLITMLLFLITANAQIIYTDINPDSVLKKRSDKLDMNNDGIIDFTLSQTTYASIPCPCGGPGMITDASIGFPTNNGVAAYSVTGNADTFDSVQVIGSAISNWGDLGELLSSQAGSCTGRCTQGGGSWEKGGTMGRWSGESNKYLALKMLVAEKIYYGWVRLNVGQGGMSITVKDYAYNSIPNQPIRAGETSCTTPTVEVSANGSLSFCQGDSITLTANTTAYQFQWQRNGIEIGGATSSTFVVKVAGDYRCSVTNSCGNKISKILKVITPCKEIFNNSTVENDKRIIKALQLKVIPNPFLNSTTISFIVQQPENISLRIYDMAGRLVKVLSDKMFREGYQSIQWNIENANAGIYLLRIESADFSQTQKLIVNH